MTNPEKKILAHLLKNKSNIALCLETISPKYFSTEYRKFYTSIVNFYTRYRQAISADIIVNGLKRKGASKDKIDYYVNLMQDLKSMPCEQSEFGFLLDSFKERFFEKRLKEGIEESVVYLSEVKEPLKAHSVLRKAVLEVEGERAGERKREGSFKESTTQRKEEYLYYKEHPEKRLGIQLGFGELDSATGGLRPEELLVVVGPTSTGKSITLLRMAYNVWVSGKNVLYYSLEMSKKKLEKRLESMYSGLLHKKIRDYTLTPEEEKVYFENLEKQKTESGEFWIADYPRDVTPLFIESRYEKILDKFTPDIIVIDYIGIMKPNKLQQTDWLDQGQISKELHELARAWKKPVITAVQATSAQRRMFGKNSENLYGTHRVARSQMIADNADIVVQIAEISQDELEGITYHATKVRDGERVSWTMYKDFTRMIIRDKDWVPEGLEEE